MPSAAPGNGGAAVVSREPKAGEDTEDAADVRALGEDGFGEDDPGCCSWLCCRMVCWFFCCPPCPSRIVAKQAFLPPQ